MALIIAGSGGDGDSAGRDKENEKDSQSGSANTEQEINPRKKNKRHQRHTPEQIQELEAFFQKCQHPDEKQRMNLGRQLSLESHQVKFWFQNRRTLMKSQIERHENSLLRQENDKLRAESLTLREATRSPLCNNCGGPAMLGEVSMEEQHLRIENARLKDELDRVCALVGKFLGHPILSLPSPFPPLHHSALHSALGSSSTSDLALGSSSTSDLDHTGIASAGRRSMLKLAQRMTEYFCAGVSTSSPRKWTPLRFDNIGKGVSVMTRQSLEPGEPPGELLRAATSVWLPVAPSRLFDFLRDGCLRSEWDILSNGGQMQEMAHIAKGQDHGNALSLFRSSSAVSANQSSMLMLQDTCTDSSGSLVVYAAVDISTMHLVMNGGDSDYVALLPSGFAIAPDGPPNGGNWGGGSQLTVAFQILVNSLPGAKLTEESAETVNNLISCTVQKIKAALHCESLS